MTKDKIVQFVCFETKLNHDQFLTQWEHYSRSVNSDHDVVLHQSEHEGNFRYIAQHRCTTGELNFAFTKGKKSSHTPEIGIKTKQVGGYAVLQEKGNDVDVKGLKIFSFITDPTVNLGVYRKLSAFTKLNIYQAYYENCNYAYILEFYVKDKNVAVLKEELKLCSGTDCNVYQEMRLHAV